MKLKRKTFFLDQGEFLGGGERFLIDFLQSLNDSEIRKIFPILVGAKSPIYKKFLLDEETNESLVKILDFKFPQVRGNIFIKFLKIFELFAAAKRLNVLVKQEQVIQFFSNTPRTHLVMFLSKMVFRTKGRWICFFHDFTLRPKFLLQWVCNRADVLVANALPTRNFLRENISKKNFRKIRIVENGINFETVLAACVPEKIKKVLILGRLDPQKGQMFALRVARIFLNKNSQVKFSVVGSSVLKDKRTVEYEQQLKNFTQEHRLENVNFMSEVKNPFIEIQKYDVLLVLPTEPETFGRIVIEALALGKLVLSFDETGPREILKNFYQFLGQKDIYLEQNPFLVKSCNAIELAEKLEFFVKNPESVHQVCSYGREFVEKNYPLSETKKRLLAILSE
ncbi:glycosyltransferase family 4 protein [Candidatus Gracilibacteria bacterium]|nr:glycosyltransferase family 4 protein [Candidatus Gracilibacteria bacterium]